MRIAAMSLQDLGVALDWAAAEGWNPGLDDAAAFHAVDPEGFLMGWIGGEPIACISVVRHSAAFGFLGLYICRPQWRGRGHGRALWLAGLRHLGGRTVGLDGVLAQQENYRRSGFVLARRTIRYRGAVPAGVARGLEKAGSEMLPEILALDRAASGVDRAAYLAAWVTEAPARHTLVSLTRGRVTGIGTVRRCREGAKLGPLFAGDAEEARRLIGALAAYYPGEALSLDVPEPNRAAMALAEGLGLAPVFETARMYRGDAPAGRLDRVFGEATLELG